jgi:hypothetical protein
MDLDAALSDVRQAIEAKRPRDFPVHDFLRRLVESYVPDEPTELSEGQAEAILLARGLLARQRLTEAEGGSISAPEVARILGLTRQGVDYQRREGLLIAWRTSEGRWHYPVWQFSPHGMLPGIRECLKELETDPEWGAMIFFLSRRDSLGGKRPLDLLKEGRLEEALSAARRHLRHGA